MAGFLTGLGDIAGGAAAPLQQDLNQYFQQQQANQDATNAGLGVYAMLGITPPATQQQGGLGSILGGLFGGQQGQQGAQQAAPPPPSTPSPAAPLMQANIQTPQISPPPTMGQGGTARSPMPAPQAAPTQIQGPGQGQSPLNAPSAAPNTPVSPSASIQGNPVAPAALQGAPPPPGPPVPRGQPGTAQPGVTAPGQQAQQVPTPPPAQPAAQPQAQAQNQAVQPQNQQQGQSLDHYKDMFDYPTLVKNLVNTPGMNPTKLGKIISSDGFKNMLTQEGLAQYRAAGLGIKTGNLDERRRNDDTKAGEADRRSADVERAQKFRQQATVYSQGAKAGEQEKSLIRQQTAQKVSAIVSDFNIKQEDKQKQIDALQQQESEAVDKINKKIGDPPEMEKESSGGEQGGGADEVAHDPKTGKMYRYNGSGSRADMSNYTPLN